MATQTATRQELKLKFPDTYHLVFYNDDTTDVNFVLNVIVNVVGLPENDAFEKVMEIHESGSCTVIRGLTKQKANELKDKCISTAQKEGYHDFTVDTEKD